MIYELYEKTKEKVDLTKLKQEHETCWDFYIGDQWKHVPKGNTEVPMFNITTNIVDYKIATVQQNNVVVRYSSLDKEENQEIFNLLNRYHASAWENGKMDTGMYKLITHSAVTGDGFIFFPSDDTTDYQILPSIQVVLGDETCEDIQKQPFILLRERLPVNEVKKMAKANGIAETEIDIIKADDDRDILIGGRENTLSDGKITCVTKLEKKKGVVWVGKGIKGFDIEEMRPLQSENIKGEVVARQTLYPIDHLVWDTYPNKARGIGVVKNLIPNQISINLQIARRLIASKQFTFPKPVVDRTIVKNASALSEFGSTIEVNGIGDKPVSNFVSYLQPPPVHYDAKQINDDLMEVTRSLAGASNSTMGEIDPRRVASSTLQIIREQANLSLLKQIKKVTQCYENIAKIWLEIWQVYSNNDFVVASKTENDKIIEGGVIKVDDIRTLKASVTVEVSQDTTWSRASEEETLKEWLSSGQITLKEYAKLTNNKSINKEGLLTIIKEREIEAQRQQALIQQETTKRRIEDGM